MEKIQKKVEHYIEAYHMLDGVENVVAGVSGGADSSRSIKKRLSSCRCWSKKLRTNPWISWLRKNEIKKRF